MSIMKKFWQIKGTDTFAEVKSELKPQRDALNIAAGINIKTEPASQWPYKITKGPEHPHNMPYFHEVKVGALYSRYGITYKKCDNEITGPHGRVFNDGLLGNVDLVGSTGQCTLV